LTAPEKSAGETPSEKSERRRSLAIAGGVTAALVALLVATSSTREAPGKSAEPTVAHCDLDCLEARQVERNRRAMVEAMQDEGLIR
jgi:hypothetical protein